MKRYGVFDIMGPVMVGPSSSHTAGAARIGLIARHLFGAEPLQAEFYLHGSFAMTYQGHGTDKALLAGVMGISPADYKLREAFLIAEKRGLTYHFEPADLGDVHPNTVRIVLKDDDERYFSLVGSSIGGGSVQIIEIDGVHVNFSGERPILVTTHLDEPGVVAKVAVILFQYGLNIGNMQINRGEGSKEAGMYMELDGMIPKNLKQELECIEGMEQVLLLETLPECNEEEPCLN